MYVRMYVYHTAVLAPVDPLRSYRENLNWCVPLCMLIRVNSVYWRLLPSGGAPAGGV
jgi:hypothetical protein